MEYPSSYQGRPRRKLSPVTAEEAEGEIRMKLLRRDFDPSLPLDKITVASRMQISKIEPLLKLINTEWANTILHVICPSRSGKSSGWCGLKSTRAAEKQCFTRKIFKKQLEELTEMKVISKVQRTPLDGVVVHYFCVPKGSGNLARAITDCRSLNSVTEKPPKFKLVSNEQIFQLLALFESPHLAACDYRHYFYQIEIEASIRKFFSIRLQGGGSYQMNVLPMGFSWSPFVAQGLTLSMIYSARQRWAKEVAQPEIPKDIFEPFVRFVDREGNTVAVCIAIYDNVLIIADSKYTRMQIMHQMTKVHNDVGCVVKGNEKKKMPEDVPSTLPQHQVEMSKKELAEVYHPGWELNEDRVIVDHTGEIVHDYLPYLGVDYTTANNVVRWRHSRENVARWTESFEVMKAELLTCRQVAELVGVLLWDARISGLPLGGIFGSIELLSQVGKTLTESDDWDTPAMIEKEDVEFLWKTFKGFLKESGKEEFKERRTIPNEFEHIEYLAADASKIAGAAVRLTDGEPEVIWRKEWSEREKKRSINWRETITAIEGIRAIVKRHKARNEGSLKIVLAEDNTTAMSAINTLYYPRGEYLCGELFKLYHEMGDSCGVTALYEQTDNQPADLPSREKMECLSPERLAAWKIQCAESKARLKAAIETTLSFKVKRGGHGKRPREME